MMYREDQLIYAPSDLVRFVSSPFSTWMDRYNIERIGVSHCTGLEKASRLHNRLGERFFFGMVGTVVEA